MSAYVSYTDIVTNIYRSVGNADRVGFDSKWTGESHPATNKKIEGWHWDKRTWPSEDESLQPFHIPMLYDPPFYDTEDSDWTSGIGHGDDLKLLEVVQVYRDGQKLWIPKVEHGYFFHYYNQFYLYSDGLTTSRLTEAVDSGNFQYVTLDDVPKPTVPVRVYNYVYDATRGRYEYGTEFEKRLDFTPLVSSGAFLSVRDDDDNLIHANVDVTEPEFIVEFDDPDSPPTVIVNGEYITSVHDGIALSGVDSLVEVLGTCGGGPNQVFYTHYSPLLPGITPRVWTYASTAAPTEWTVMTGVNPSLTGNNRECMVDLDTGMVAFGDHDPLTGSGSGMMPFYSHKVAIQYSGTFFVDYEAENTPDYRLADTADMNTLHGVAPNGFVHTRAGVPNPASLTLEADLSEISDDRYGPLYLGYAYTRLSCSVKDEWGEDLESQTVRFEILGRSLGSFGLGQSTAEAVTTYNGEAITFYNPPLSIDSMGDATDEITVAGGTTSIFLSDLAPPSTDDPLFLYKVTRYDELAGWPESELRGTDGYYDTYFQEALISPPGLLEDEESWEALYRAGNDLSTPITYDACDLITGAKRAVLAWDSAAVNPESGSAGAWTMLQPEQYIVTESGVTLEYDAVLDEIDASGEFKSYFVAAASEVTIRASVYNSILRRRVYSNTISIRLSIPDSMNGTYVAESLAALPSGMLMRPKNDTEFSAFFAASVYDGSWIDEVLEDAYYEERIWDDDTETVETPLAWFERTRRGDNDLLGLEPVDLTVSGEATIPLGFRIRSAGVTFASALDGVVFLNPNSTILSGVFD